MDSERMMYSESGPIAKLRGETAFVKSNAQRDCYVLAQFEDTELGDYWNGWHTFPASAFETLEQDTIVKKRSTIV